MERVRREDKERLEIHKTKINHFYEEMNKGIENTLNDSLIDFIDEYDLEINDDIIHYLRKYNEFLKGGK